MVVQEVILSVASLASRSLSRVLLGECYCYKSLENGTRGPTHDFPMSGEMDALEVETSRDDWTEESAVLSLACLRGRPTRIACGLQQCYRNPVRKSLASPIP